MLQTSVADGEAGGHWQPGATHLGEACAFAAEDVFHLAVAVGRAAAERVYVLLLLSSPEKWLRFLKNPRWWKNSRRMAASSASGGAHAIVFRVDENFVENRSTWGGEWR